MVSANLGFMARFLRSGVYRFMKIKYDNRVNMCRAPHYKSIQAMSQPKQHIGNSEIRKFIMKNEEIYLLYMV